METVVCTRCGGSGYTETWDEDHGYQRKTCIGCENGQQSVYGIFDSVFGNPIKKKEKRAYGAYRTFNEWFDIKVEPTLEARLKKFNVCGK